MAKKNTVIEKRPEFQNITSVIEVVHKQIRINSKAESVKHDPCKFYPSSVGKCLRAIVYQMKGYPSEINDGRVLLILENGNHFHTRVEELFADTGMLVAPELSIRIPELRLSGRSDAIILNILPHEPSNNTIKLFEALKDDEIKAGKKPKVIWEGPDNDVMIVELKSISESGFNYLGKTGAKEAHIMQLQLYMHITGIKQGCLLYENKNTQEMKEYFIKYDEKMAIDIMNKIASANKHVNEDTLPAREYCQTDFECRYCDYADICYPPKNKYNIADILK